MDGWEESGRRVKGMVLMRDARYNTFFILYPMGAGSEAMCIFTSLHEAWKWDQRYYWFLVVVLVTYPPGEFSPVFFFFLLLL